MEPTIGLFPDLLFVRCVTFRETKQWCASAVSTLCSLVAIKQTLGGTVGCMEVGTDTQGRLCTDSWCQDK